MTFHFLKKVGYVIFPCATTAAEVLTMLLMAFKEKKSQFRWQGKVAEERNAAAKMF